MNTTFARRVWLIGAISLVVIVGALLGSALPVEASPTPVRISQIYGAGGNQGAIWQADFVELFNASSESVILDGWTVEYAPSGSANWKQTSLAAFTIAPMSYLLVAQAAGNSGAGVPLPLPDIVGTTNLNAADGKVRLVDASGAVVDLVGYGDADEFEGSAPAPALSVTLAAIRTGEGCVDTNQNGSDFSAGPPQPRTSVSPSHPCASEPLPTSTATSPPAETPTGTVESSPTVTVTLAPPTPTPEIPPISISEFLADPAASDDNAGEWLEVVNTGMEAVNLRNWVLADLEQDRHPITTDLWIEPGGYVVLGRNGNPAENGGVTMHYIYSSLTLANGEDELLLITPDGQVVDQVVWRAGTGLTITSGASLYRTESGASWLLSQAPWPGSAGDFGHPGGPAPTEVPTPATPAAPATATPTPTVTPSPTPISLTPVPFVLVYLSEFMADPAAVSDSAGEWFELVNPGSVAVNLQGWQIIDESRDQYVIDAELWIGPGEYCVLTRHGDPAQNGGVTVHHVYDGVTLGNEDDRLVLLDAVGREVDRVSWGSGTVLSVKAGASLERISLEAVAQWQPAHSAWPGSAGDRGSPGGPYLSPSLFTATVTPTPTAVVPTVTPTPTQSPTPTRTPTLTPTRPASIWPMMSDTAPLQIEEVYGWGSGTEFVALLNTGATVLELTGWHVGDAHFPANGEGIYALPDGYPLAPGALFVIARNAAEFQTQWGLLPHAQFESSSVDVPVLARRREWASGTFALNDSGDEVVLVDPAGRLADAIAYGSGEWAGLGLAESVAISSGTSFQRVPGVAFPAERDPRQRFLKSVPDPAATLTLPTGHAAPLAPLPDGYLAAFGSLGAISTFSPDGTAPPRWLEWAAAASGLHFIAIADPVDPAQRGSTSAPVVSLQAWRWQQNTDHHAIIYGPYAPIGSDLLGLSDYLSRHQVLVQWSGDHNVAPTGLAAIAGDDLDAPGDFFARWQPFRTDPPLLVGNALPPLPGYLDSSPRYTGLAIRAATESEILDALRTRRGWLTTQPGIALTLRTESGVWMGGAMPASQELAFRIDYSDSSSEVAGLALWQDGQPVQQLDFPPADGHWRVALPAPPGSLFYAVATQPDGDFAVTAPIRVLENGPAQVWINEIMPVPLSDFSGDGTTDTGDEYVELFNAGPSPLSLAGWHLEDRPLESPEVRRRFGFGAHHVLPVGGRLIIWGRESGIGLNNRNERLELTNASGTVIDSFTWENSPGGDRSFSRVPDGGTWQIWSPTPGQSNGNFVVVIPTPTPPAWEVAGSAAPGTPGGEAVSTFGSVTQAKLAGMERGCALWAWWWLRQVSSTLRSTWPTRHHRPTRQRPGWGYRSICKAAAFLNSRRATASTCAG